MENLIRLRDYLSKSENHNIDLKSLFNLDREIGLDEIPHDREFFKELFELSDSDFDFLFIPKNIKINTVREYVALLSTFIHLKS